MQNMKDGKSSDEMYSKFSMKAAVCSNDLIAKLRRKERRKRMRRPLRRKGNMKEI